MCIHVNHWTIYDRHATIVLSPRRKRDRRSRALHTCWKSERENEPKNSIELCLWHYSRYIQYWILMLIPSLWVVFLSLRSVGFWFGFLSSIHLIPFVHSLVYSLIRHMCTPILFSLCTISMHHSHTYIKFFSLSLFSPSHFRHANSHRRQFFHSFSNARMYSLRIYHIRTVFFFQKKTRKNQHQTKEK